MRKSFLVAGVATLAFGTAGVAYAQTPAPSIEATVKVSPTKAGTKSKPKSREARRSRSRTTRPEQDDREPRSRSRSRARSSSPPRAWTSARRPTTSCSPARRRSARSRSPAPARRTRIVNPYATSPGAAHVQGHAGRRQERAALLPRARPAAPTPSCTARSSGKKLTIEITRVLQQPAPGTYSALRDLSTTLSKKKGKNALIASAGCKSKKHKVAVTVAYVPNPQRPRQVLGVGHGRRQVLVSQHAQHLSIPTAPRQRGRSRS